MIARPDDSQDALEWLEMRINFTLGTNTRLISVKNEDGVYAGVMGIGGRMGNTIGSVSIAVDDEAATLPLVRASVRYVFGQLKMEAAYITISGNRWKWLQKLKRVIGFVEVDRVRNGMERGVDLVVLKATPATCRPWQASLRKQWSASRSEVA